MEKSLSFKSIMERCSAFWESQILFTAVELDIFSRISGMEPVGAKRLCDASGLDEKAGTILLNSLCALGFLEKEAGGAYRNRKIAQRYLVSGCRDDRRAIINHLACSTKAWNNLTGAVRTGESSLAIQDDLFGGDRKKTEDFIIGMDNVANERIEDILPHLSLHPDGELLDLGGGPGTYAIGFCKKYPKLWGTVFDLPLASELAEKNIIKHGMNERVRTEAGDFLKDPIGSGYQTIWISQVLHCLCEKSNRLLLEKCISALVSGGQIILHDFFLDDSGTSPGFGALFSVHMLVCTRGGRTYTAKEVKNWLEDSGFDGILVKPLNPDSTIITAFKN